MPDETESIRALAKVLCVDDHPSARASLAALIQTLGVAVDTAEDGDMGLEMFRGETYEVVITDMNMPGIDGLTLTEKIKQIAPCTTVLLVSGGELVDCSKVDQEFQPDSVLPKPISYDVLVKALSGVLGSRDCVD